MYLPKTNAEVKHNFMPIKNFWLSFFLNLRPFLNPLLVFRIILLFVSWHGSFYIKYSLPVSYKFSLNTILSCTFHITSIYLMCLDWLKKKRKFEIDLINNEVVNYHFINYNFKFITIIFDEAKKYKFRLIN